MDEAYDKAKANKDLEGMRQAAATEVALIGPLINQTKDEKIRVQYERWEARLLIRIALIETDADKKKAYLARAQSVFERELGKAPEGSPERDGYRYQLALISYQLGDYKKVQMEMGTLIAEGRLGAAERLVPDPAGGPGEYKDNPVYWEGLLRFMQANLALAKEHPDDPQLKEALENARQTLKAQYINKGKHVGGPLAAEYQVFKKQLLGDWDETKIDISKAATRPTTRPATAAAAK
jgi:hypothetical protein